MHKCEGCGTTDVHADDCPALDAPGSELPCLDVTPHAKHPYPFGTSYRECPGYETEPLTSEALEHVTKAIARHDLDKTVGLEPDAELPAKDHPFWAMWRAAARVAIDAYFAHAEKTGHIYLSTSCKHGEHGYCQSNTGSQGQKIPAQCKFCASPCVCSCHFLGAAPVKTPEITS